MEKNTSGGHTRHSKSFGNGPRRRPFHGSSGRPHGNFRRGHPGRGNRGGKGQNIHHSKFINKGVDEVVAQYVPKHTFNDFAIDARIKANIAQKGYVTPTAIQDQAIPVILEGKDIVGIANTGTGKTGAFIIPLLSRAAQNPSARVLIMVPTRELAVQIEEEYRAFAQNMNIHSVSLVGGANIYRQISALRRNPRFIIGTPGRIKDLLERKAMILTHVQTVVLDEADRMLDMGFINDMRSILGRMPAQRHTLFFSATLSPDIDRLIKDFLRDPVRVSVKTGDTSKSVDQDIVRVNGSNKIDTLMGLLSKPDFDKVIIFGRTKHGVERLAKTITEKGVRSDSIHGDKSQGQRQRALDDFKANRVRVLVATDVAARGIDIPKVSHVINYDIPATYEDYVHRIGRTGRAGQRGKALTFVE